MAINFLSEEWAELRDVLREMEKSEINALIAANDEKTSDRHRGGLNAVRRLLNLEKRKPQQQQQPNP
jgi:hypothetical protein